MAANIIREARVQQGKNIFRLLDALLTDKHELTM
jgi:hypothetical protein